MTKYTGPQRLQIEAASNSLKLSIAEIEAHLEGKGIRGTPGHYRAELHGALAEFAAHWYRRGFNRGHRESYELFEDTGAVPKALRAKVKRDLFAGNRKSVKLRSRIK